MPVKLYSANISEMQTIASILPWLQVIFSVILVALVLLQQSDAGLGSAFGGGMSSDFHTKRGIEKKIFIGTIIVAILFILSTILALFV